MPPTTGRLRKAYPTIAAGACHASQWDHGAGQGGPAWNKLTWRSHKKIGQGRATSR